MSFFLSSLISFTSQSKLLTCHRHKFYPVGYQLIWQPASFGNAAMIKERKLLLHPPLSHSDHLVIKSSDHYLGSHPLLIFQDPLTKLRYSLMFTSKHHLVPIYICIYCKNVISVKHFYSTESIEQDALGGKATVLSCQRCLINFWC